MVELIDAVLDVPKLYYGALLGVGFCTYYLCEVVKVSELLLYVLQDLINILF